MSISSEKVGLLRHGKTGKRVNVVVDDKKKGNYL